MSGSHRSMMKSRAVSVRKSTVWLLQLGGATTALLLQMALVVFVGYILITQPWRAWPLPLAVACGINACVYVLLRVIWRGMKRRPV
jgi:hypothetical protein